MQITVLLSILAIANPFSHKGPRDTLADYIGRARQAETSAAPPQTPGSLWAPQGRFTYIAADYKALNVGDVITIRIVEDTNARNTGSTAANRTFDTKSGITGIAGRVNTGGVQNLFSANSASDLKGKAQAATTATLRTSLAGRVMAVLGNGTLVVQAQRDVYMNNERQKVLVRGLVRPGDVASDNSVLSTAMSDLEIELKGKGVISDANRPPNFLVRWLMKLVNF